VACVPRHSHTIAGALSVLAAVAFGLTVAQAQWRTDLYDRPVLAIDPGMHISRIPAQAVDREGRFGVTGSLDRTVRIWSLANGKLLRTIWIPMGPYSVGAIYAVAISPDGSTVAAGGMTETYNGAHPIYLFDRESGGLIHTIRHDLPTAPPFSLSHRMAAT
jgi:WD40 repeat protein